MDAEVMILKKISEEIGVIRQDIGFIRKFFDKIEEEFPVRK
jgi:hypothetical protein